MTYGTFGLIVLILDLYALVQIVASRAPRRTKILWALAVLLLPALGFVAWLVAGPRGHLRL